MEPDEHLSAFHREADAIPQVVDAKFDGINRVLTQMGETLSKLGQTVERQSEQNTQLAVLTNTVAHIQAHIIDNRQTTDARFDIIENRIGRVETSQKAIDEKVTLRNWKLNAIKALVVAGVTGAVAFTTANFEHLMPLLGLG